MNRTRIAQRLYPLYAVAVTILTLSACDDSSNAGARSDEPTPSQPVTSSSSAAPGTSQPAGTDFTVHYTASDGSRATVTFTLHAPVEGGDQSVAAHFPNATPCPADTQRDTVFLGTLTITNDTPNFDATLDIAMDTANEGFGAATLNFGIAYSNGNRCADINGTNGPALQAVGAQVSGNKWGPAPVEFVVHGVYTPAMPAGDMSVVTANNPRIFAYAGSATDQYHADSISGPITTAILGELTLNLDKLAGS